MDKKSKEHVSNILVVTYWSFSDALVQTYTLPYLKIIKGINPQVKFWLVTQEVNNRKIPLKDQTRKELADYDITCVSFKYVRFGIMGSLNILWMICSLFMLVIRKGINFIHSWGTPPGVIALPLSILTQRPLIIDSYEPHADAMVENGTWSKNSVAYKILISFEKWQSRRASFFISATEGMRDYATKMYRVEFTDNFFVKPACVDLNLFSETNKKKKYLLKKLGLQNKIVGVYAGKFGGIYLDHEVFDLVRAAIDYWGDRFRFLLLTSHSKEEVQIFQQKNGIEGKFVVQKFVAHQDVPDYMGLADFGITPVKPVPTKRYCTPIKDGEYWALGLPVVITKNISDDSDIIKENDIGYVLESMESMEYEQAMKKMNKFITGDIVNTGKKIRMIAMKYRNFDVAKKVYKHIYGKIDIA